MDFRGEAVAKFPIPQLEQACPLGVVRVISCCQTLLLMNSTPDALPDFRSLYWSDFTIRRAVVPIIMGLMLAAGMWWMVQPIPNAVPQEEVPPEIAYAPWLAAGGLVVSAVSALVLVRRYLLVKKILGEGSAVKGTAVKVDRYDSNRDRNSSTSTLQFTTSYVYYVTIRYEVQGVERKVRLKLLFSPGTYGIKEDGEVELLVLDAKPRKPLIRAMYLGGILPRRRRRFFW